MVARVHAFRCVRGNLVHPIINTESGCDLNDSLLSETGRMLVKMKRAPRLVLKKFLMQRDLRKLMRSASATQFTRLRSKFRRLFLCASRPEYVEEQIRHRAGECVQCGKCCKLVFKCPFLGGTDENPRCQVYDGRPKPCVAFPIDERDLADVNFQCGYFFTGEKTAAPDLVQIALPAYAASAPTPVPGNGHPSLPQHNDEYIQGAALNR